MSQVKLEVHASPQPVKTLKHHILTQWRKSDASAEFKQSVDDFLAALPLVTSLIAPLSTLYDIPGLTQRWYTFNGEEVSDPPANVALSAVGLAFNAIANAALVYRFSASTKHRKPAVLLSTACWVIKGIIAVVNLCIYGARTRNAEGYAYSTGFWCAVLSAILASLNAMVLVVYAAYMRRAAWRDNRKIQVQGRHFVLSELLLFWIIAVWALIFSRIEHWQYFDAVYFCVVTTLTCGFGDYSPTVTSTKVLTFPFALVSIAALATQVSAIIGYFSDRAVKRKTRWRAAYEKRSFHERDNLHPSDELIAEMDFLRQLVMQENAASRLYDLILSLFAFSAFWCVGAVVFSKTEGWTYGDSLYFSYVFFLTVGYGDLSPESSAGKVFFVIYALIAVPIVASFAVQTVTAVWQAGRERRLEKNKVKMGLVPAMDRSATIAVQSKSRERGSPPQTEDSEHSDDDEEEVEIRPFLSHAELVVQVHKQRGYVAILAEDIHSRASPDLGDVLRVDSVDIHTKVSASQTDLPDPPRDSGLTDDGQHDDASCRREEERKLLCEMLELMGRLEVRARRMLIDKLEPGSRSRLLLQADKNVTERTVELLSGETIGTPSLPSGNLNDLQEIHAYRSTWAELLVAGTRLQRLQGIDQLIHERRRGVPYGPDVQ